MLAFILDAENRVAAAGRADSEPIRQDVSLVQAIFFLVEECSTGSIIFKRGEDGFAENKHVGCLVKDLSSLTVFAIVSRRGRGTGACMYGHKAWLFLFWVRGGAEGDYVRVIQ